ncbi:MAG: hypothetical protein J0M02_11665, partial [Planctomycetes bacterium]|nr:hypothetical protein [Planctomycetota bacterium]
QERRVEVPANGRSDVVLVGASAEPGGDPQQARVEVSYRVDGGPWDGLISVPLRLVRAIPAGTDWNRPADWTLDTQDAIVDYCTADPSLRDQSWKGPQDLSARIWLGRSPDALRVHVEVRDNVHHQVEPADTAWRGDSVQLGVQAPGQKGFFELTTAMHADGGVLRAVGSSPAGLQAKAADYAARASRSGDATIYDIEIPLQRFGLDGAVLASGLRFNLIVNDNDGPLRKGYIRVAPGIGEGKDSSQFPLVRFDAR